MWYPHDEEYQEKAVAIPKLKFHCMELVSIHSEGKFVFGFYDGVWGKVRSFSRNSVGSVTLYSVDVDGVVHLSEVPEEYLRSEEEGPI